MMYQYPLQMSFKLLAFGPQISVKDPGGREIFYVHQKALKLKEDVGVFSDSSRGQQLFRIQADRIIDFSAAYTITDMNGMVLGKIRREGMRSIFKASYLVFNGADQQTHIISEDNPWVRVGDAVMESIPILNMLAGYFFHPSYTAERTHGGEAMRLKKEPAFFESAFSVTSLDPALNNDEERLLLLSYMMMILLERARG